MPIAIKLAMSIALLIGIGMSLMGYAILQHQKNVLTEQVGNMGNTLAKQLASNASDMVMADDLLGLQTLVNGLPDNNVLGVLVVSEKGATLAKSGIQPEALLIEAQRKNALLRQVHEFEWRNPIDANILISFISPIEFNNLVAGHVLLTFSRSAMQLSLRESGLMIIQITMLTTLLAIVVAFVMSRHLSRPIHHLVVASQEIDRGNYAYRLHENRNDEIGELAQAFNQMAEGLLRKTQVESAFSRYVSSNVARKIMETPDQIELGGKHMQASVIFADVVGFTSMAEKMPPHDVIELLNEYFSLISKVSSLHNGHIDKFIGDCAMIVFGAPDEDAEHSFHALACAVMIRKLVTSLNESRIRQGLLPVHFRIGVNSGGVVAGNLGSYERMDYTVIGDTVNLASRLATLAGSDQIVILDELYSQPAIRARLIAHAHQTIQVRGKDKPVTTWLVDDVSGESQQIMQQHIDGMLQERLAS